MATAGQLPDPLGASLLEHAREAFTQGLQLTAGISAAVAAIISIVAVLLLRRVGGNSELEGKPDPSQDGAVVGSVRVERVREAATMATEPS